MRSLKVAVIEPVGGHGGMDYYDFALCRSLTSAGVRTVLYTCDETTAPPGASYKVKTVFRGIFGQSPAIARGMRYLLGLMLVCLDVLRTRTGICHCHFFHVGLVEWGTVHLFRLLRRRIVITSHDVDSFVGGLSIDFCVRSTYRAAHRIIAHNEISKQELTSSLRTDPGRIAVISSGNYFHVTDNAPDRNSARTALGIDSNWVVLLSFGHIKQVKGLDILIAAMARILESRKDVYLLVAGKPWKTSFESYQKQIDSLGIAQNCICHIRHIADDELPMYFSACDLIVQPYRRIYQSAVLLLALSYGKPVLASNLPGMMEVIDDGKTGFLFEEGSVEHLSSRVKEIVSDRQKMSAVGAAARKLMRDDYSWETMGLRTAKLYASLYGNR